MGPMLPTEEVALAFLHLANFNCQGKNDSNEVFSCFYGVMKYWKDKKGKNATSNSLLQGTKANIRSLFLMQNQNTMIPASLKI